MQPYPNERVDSCITRTKVADWQRQSALANTVRQAEDVNHCTANPGRLRRKVGNCLIGWGTQLSQGQPTTCLVTPDSVGCWLLNVTEAKEI